MQSLLQPLFSYLIDRLNRVCPCNQIAHPSCENDTHHNNAMGGVGLTIGQQKATSYGRCWAYNGTTAGPLTKGVVTS